MAQRKGSAKDITPIIKETAKNGFMLINNTVINAEDSALLAKMYPDIQILSVAGDVRAAVAILGQK